MKVKVGDIIRVFPSGIQVMVTRIMPSKYTVEDGRSAKIPDHRAMWDYWVIKNGIFLDSYRYIVQCVFRPWSYAYDYPSSTIMGKEKPPRKREKPYAWTRLLSRMLWKRAKRQKKSGDVRIIKIRVKRNYPREAPPEIYEQIVGESIG